jgi:hypothetical protein
MEKQNLEIQILLYFFAGQENNQTITLEDLEEYVIGAALHPAQVSFCRKVYIRDFNCTLVFIAR